MSTRRSDLSGPLAGRLFDRVLDNVDLDKRTATLADKLCVTMVEHNNLGRLVRTRCGMHGEELQQGLMDAIVHRL